MSRSWQGGSTRGWRKLRAAVLARDGWRCRVRIAGLCTERATVVHHTRGKAHGDDPAYLEAACAACNARVNDPARSSAHQQVVAWARSRHGASARTIAAAFPHITAYNIAAILQRAVRRGELVRGRTAGVYVAGPTGLPPSGATDPPHRPMTRW